MALLKLFAHRRSEANLFHKLCCLSRHWKTTSGVSACASIDDSAKRSYSGLAVQGTKLQLRQCKGSPLCMVNSKRHYEYNLFYLLVELQEQLFHLVKDEGGFSWCSTIVFATIPVRMIISIILKKKTVEMKYKTKTIFEEKLRKIETMERIKLNSHRHMSEEKKRKMFAKAMKAHQKRIFKEENFSPWILHIYSLAPLPWWIANSWALRNLAGIPIPFAQEVYLKCPDLQTGGMLWFQNLCEADPYHILPILTSLSFFMSIELNTLLQRGYKPVPWSKKSGLMKAQSVIENLFRVYCVFSLYIFWNIPAILTWYWCTSGLLVFMYRILLHSPEAERMFVPKNVHEDIDEHPIKTIMTNAKRRYNPKNWFMY